MNKLQEAFRIGFQKEAQPMEAQITNFQSENSGDTGSDFSTYSNKPMEVQMTNNENQNDFSGLEDMGMAGAEAFANDNSTMESFDMNEGGGDIMQAGPDIMEGASDIVDSTFGGDSDMSLDFSLGGE